MPEFCPKCGNMMGAGYKRCSVCGARMRPRVLDEETGFTWADLFSYSAVTILFSLAAIILPVLVVWGCLLLYLR